MIKDHCESENNFFFSIKLNNFFSIQFKNKNSILSRIVKSINWRSWNTIGICLSDAKKEKFCLKLENIFCYRSLFKKSTKWTFSLFPRIYAPLKLKETLFYKRKKNLNYIKVLMPKLKGKSKVYVINV